MVFTHVTSIVNKKATSFWKVACIFLKKNDHVEAIVTTTSAVYDVFAVALVRSVASAVNSN